MKHYRYLYMALLILAPAVAEADDSIPKRVKRMIFCYTSNLFSICFNQYMFTVH